jgi:hypothetical protein
MLQLSGVLLRDMVDMPRSPLVNESLCSRQELRMNILSIDDLCAALKDLC